MDNVVVTTMNLRKIFGGFKDGELLSALNQNPEPIIYYQAFDVDAGTTSPNTPFRVGTQLGGGEIARIYSIMAHVLPQGMTITTNNTINSGPAVAVGTQVWLSGYDDITLTIRVGANMIPNMPFDVAGMNNSSSKTIVLPTPIIVRHSDDLTLSLQNTDPTLPNSVPGTAPNAPGTVSRVKLYLIGEAVNEAELRRRLLRQKVEAAVEEASIVREYQK